MLRNLKRKLAEIIIKVSMGTLSGVCRRATIAKLESGWHQS